MLIRLKLNALIKVKQNYESKSRSKVIEKASNLN